VNAYLSNFAVTLPRYEIPQAQAIAWSAKLHAEAERLRAAKYPDMVSEISPETAENLFLRYAVKDNVITRRYVEFKDVLVDDPNAREIYRLSTGSPAGFDIAERSNFFAERAEKIVEQMFEETSSSNYDQYEPSHLLHVSCTGYVSPSAVQRLVALRRWQKTEITHMYHMGCYASLPAIRVAAALAQSRDAIDLVHNEMCSLHMNPLSHTPEQAVVQSLFADGHIKYKVTREPAKQNTQQFKILNIVERVIPISEKEMTWSPAKWGMAMTLSRKVPEIIGSVLNEVFEELCQSVKMNPETVRETAIFAIHPGGPKIIDSVQSVLRLTDEQTETSRKILRERGNMSSATLPHVWSDLLNQNLHSNQTVVSFAFGPGLTVFASIFQALNINNHK
jgi:predicted naringenin-chalcone synthase